MSICLRKMIQRSSRCAPRHTNPGLAQYITTLLSGVHTPTQPIQRSCLLPNPLP
jgi:hypothetical protein